MKKINWKVRFKNKVWLTAFTGAIITFMYQILGMFGVVSPFSEETVVQLVGLLINMLVSVGIIVDPTTEGMLDSVQALEYTEPRATGV